MRKKKVVFKKYVQNQPVMFPPSLEEMIPEKHPVRVVSEIVERIDISGLERSYKGGGHRAIIRAESFRPLFTCLIGWPGRVRNFVLLKFRPSPEQAVGPEK